MGPDASTGPPPYVQRQFETNRLAKDFQAKAYEEVLPIIRRQRTPTTVTALSIRAGTETERVQQGGMAA
jgi:hypothetical protein